MDLEFKSPIDLFNDWVEVIKSTITSKYPDVKVSATLRSVRVQLTKGVTQKKIHNLIDPLIPLCPLSSCSFSFEKTEITIATKENENENFTFD